MAKVTDLVKKLDRIEPAIRQRVQGACPGRETKQRLALAVMTDPQACALDVEAQAILSDYGLSAGARDLSPLTLADLYCVEQLLDALHERAGIPVEHARTSAPSDGANLRHAAWTARKDAESDLERLAILPQSVAERATRFWRQRIAAADARVVEIEARGSGLKATRRENWAMDGDSDAAPLA